MVGGGGGVVWDGDTVKDPKELFGDLQVTVMGRRALTPSWELSVGASLGVGPFVSVAAEVGTKLLLTAARRARKVDFALSVTVGGVARILTALAESYWIFNTQLGAPLGIPVGALDELYLRPEVNYDLIGARAGQSASQVRVGLGIGGRLACGSTRGVRSKSLVCFVELLTAGTAWEDDVPSSEGRLGVLLGGGVAF